MPFTEGMTRPANAGIKKGQKQFKTLLKEQRRAVFDAETTKVWIKTIKKLKPEYVADQFMGKAEDNVNVNVNRVIKIP